MNSGQRVSAVLIAGIIILTTSHLWAGIINVDINDGGCVTGSGQADPYSVVYCNIQDAIDDASDGDIINVAAGTYNETINIYKNNLLVQSVSGAATTIIKPTITSTGGIFSQGDGNTFDGFTVEDFSDDSNENKIVRIHTGADNNTVQNNIIRGNLNQGGISDQTEYGVLIYGSNNLIDSNEIYDIGYMGINIVGPPHSGASRNTISSNNVHDIGIYAIGFDRSPNTASANTITNLVGGNLWGYYYDPAVWCWGYVVWGASSDGAVLENNDLNGIPNGIVLSSAQGVVVINNEISVGNDGIKMTYTGWVGDTPDNNIIIGNDILSNGDEGILIPNPGAGSIGLNNQFLFNNIVGNTTFGINNLSSITIDAENNWWGDTSGPSGAGPGSGDAVSANVDYDPWLGVPVDSTATEHLTDDPDTLDATGEANTVVIKGGSGDPWVTVVQYDSNPGGTHAFTAFTGSYVDVHINDDTDVTEIEIRLYYPAGTPDEQSLKLHWWNGTDWALCNDQGVNTMNARGYGGYIWCKIRATGTVPSLTDLMGAPFGGGGEVQIYVDDSWATGYSHGDLIATNPDRYFGVNAFATIQLGLDNCASQGTVFVAPGTYTENDTINHPLVLLGSGVGNTIVNTALPGAWVTSDSATIDGFTYNGTGSDTAVFFDNVSYCTIQNSEVDNSGIGILIVGTSGTHTRRNKVLNTTSQNHNLLGSGWSLFGGSGIQVTYSDSCEIRNCLIQHLEGSGIDAWGADTLIVDNCEFFDIGRRRNRKRNFQFLRRR